MIGSALGTEVMVEGVETAEELAYLRDFTEIRVAQGFFFSRPITLSDVAGGAGTAPRQRPLPPPRPRAAGRAVANPRAPSGLGPMPFI